MNNSRTIKKTLIVVLIVWTAIWLFFLVREDKDGQYRVLGDLYRSNDETKVKVVYGNDFYDFLEFCRDNIPAGATYEIYGFEKYSIDEVRARYLLFPARVDTKNPDFKIKYGGNAEVPSGYSEFKSYNKGKRGYLYLRRGNRI
ncbi:MAG: hypothetical protein KJ995_04945 [Candidatus Omnitrophica bacterium]|nr:hypothetical protein [Candidatus Omnitrophota bacterium]MBU1128555.1 hypothetical protein [Candidatus Omnitrophota bacterium]MBU1783737.1 hypothetical protein [Candidatus Omnitrophota bacterium]MBU1851734.1 hypothetical protein [Candidatus Omnitrophota bacterium]